MSAITLSPGANFVVDAVSKQYEVITLKETGYGSRRKAVFKFTDCVLPLFDNAGVGGQIANQIFAMPSGATAVQFTSSAVDLTIERASGTTTSLADAWNGDIGVGTTTGIGAALSTTEDNIMLTTTIPVAVAGKATVNKGVPDTPAYQAPLDVSGGSVVGFLNILVDDANQDGSVTAATVKLNGTLTLHYEVVGKVLS